MQMDVELEMTGWPEWLNNAILKLLYFGAALGS